MCGVARNTYPIYSLGVGCTGLGDRGAEKRAVPAGNTVNHSTVGAFY